MKRLLWPDSLRGRLIILALVCLVVFQMVNTATLFLVQYQLRVSRITQLSCQTAEWYLLVDSTEQSRQAELLDRLKRLHNHRTWNIEFDIVASFPDSSFREGTEGPITQAPDIIAESLAVAGKVAPPIRAGFSTTEDRDGLQLAVRLKDGRWLRITRVRTVTLREEKIQHIVFLAEFLVFFIIMFWLLYRETRQLERLRRGVEQFGHSPETAEKLPEEGCREIRETALSLNRMRGRVLSSIEERDRMLSALRHDLRTPLTRLQLWAEEAEPETVRDRLLENGRQIQDMVTQSIELAGSLSTTEKQVQMDIAAFVEGAAAIDSLTESSRVLIAEACTHAPLTEDIGTVKLPRLLKKVTGKELQFRFTSGNEFPEDLSGYRLVIHCGGCMLPGREVLWRMKCAADQNVPITNYGIALAHLQGILKRSIAVFPGLAELL